MDARSDHLRWCSQIKILGSMQTPRHTKCLAHGVLCIAQLQCNAAAASARINPRGPIYCLSKLIQDRLANPNISGLPGKASQPAAPSQPRPLGVDAARDRQAVLLPLSAAILASMAYTGRRQAPIICLMALLRLSVLMLASAGSCHRTAAPSGAAGVRCSRRLDMHRPQACLDHLLGGLSGLRVLGLGVRQQHAIDDCIVVPRKHCQPNLDDSPVLHNKSCMQKK